MNNINKPLIDENKIGINPFSFPLIVPVTKIEFKNQYVVDNDNDLLPVFKEVEVTGYSKIFLSSERRIIKCNLSLRGKELILWLIDELESGKDYVWINKERYMKENKISSLNTYKCAINECIRYGFISNTIIKDVYWINPDFMFRGDRVKKYKNNIELK